MGVRSRRPRNRTSVRKRRKDELELKFIIYLFTIGFIIYLLQSCGIMKKA